MTVNACTVSLNQIPLDWRGNQQRIIDAIVTAKKELAEVILLPELCITGYGCEDWFLSDDVIEKSWQSLSEIRKHCDDAVVIVGLPCRFQEKTYNCAAVVQNGKILGINAKRALPNAGVYYESRWFTPWTVGRQETYKNVPFGDLAYQFGDFNLGIEICEEAWVEPSLPQVQPVHLVCNPSASHFEIGKDARREATMVRQSRLHKSHYAYTNMIGLESGRLIYDGSMMVIESDGQVTRQSERFGFKDSYFLLKALDYVPSRQNSLRLQGAPLPRNAKAKDVPATKNYSAHEEFLSAEALGLFDYLRKTHSKGFVISLSGGRDSSCVAILASHMRALALRELGPDGLKQRLPHLESLDADSIVTCIYQKTEHSSHETLHAAKELSRELKVKFVETDIQPALDYYLKVSEDIALQNFSWDNRSHDIALQNIQARCRVQLPWMLANLEGKVLLATTNRSEAAVGYTTMDGDSAGGLAPLGGVDKAFICEWLEWAKINSSGGLEPLTSLRHVLAVEATAELKPAEFQQTDEKDLMPFPILKRIEEMYVLDKLPAIRLPGLLQKDFPSFTLNQLEGYAEKFVRLWQASQWKRERLAPSFHIFNYTLDPKTWCRYPILSGEK